MKSRIEAGKNATPGKEAAHAFHFWKCELYPFTVEVALLAASIPEISSSKGLKALIGGPTAIEELVKRQKSIRILIQKEL